MSTVKQRILILAYYHGLGHVIRSTAAATELSHRGHDVLFACSKAAVDIPRKAGLQCIEIYELDPIPVSTEDKRSDEPQMATRPRLANPDYLQQCLREEKKLIDEFKPDLVLFDFRVTGGVSAALSGVPSMSIFNIQFFEHPMLDIAPNIMESLREQAVPEYAIRKFFGDVVVVPDYSQFDPMHRLPNDLVPLIVSNVQEVRYTGPLLRQYPSELPERQILKSTLSQHDHLIFVTMGGTSLGFKALKNVLSGLRGIPTKLVIATGPNIPSRLIEEHIHKIGLRSNAEIEIFEFSDRALEYMKASDLAIIHGGHTTLMEGIMCGTPLIIAATQGEQEKNAERVSLLDVGYVLSAAASLEEQVADLVPTCLENEGLRRRCNMVADSLRTRGTQDLAEYIEMRAFKAFKGACR